MPNEVCSKCHEDFMHCRCSQYYPNTINMRKVIATINTIEDLAKSIECDIPEQYRISTGKEILDEIDLLRAHLNIKGEFS